VAECTCSQPAIKPKEEEEVGMGTGESRYDNKKQTKSDIVAKVKRGS